MPEKTLTPPSQPPYIPDPRFTVTVYHYAGRLERNYRYESSSFAVAECERATAQNTHVF